MFVVQRPGGCVVWALISNVMTERKLYCMHRVLGFGLEISGHGFRVSCDGLHSIQKAEFAWGMAIDPSHLTFPLSPFTSRPSYSPSAFHPFGIQVSGVGFWAEGLWARVSGPT